MLKHGDPRRSGDQHVSMGCRVKPGNDVKDSGQFQRQLSAAMAWKKAPVTRRAGACTFANVQGLLLGRKKRW